MPVLRVDHVTLERILPGVWQVASTGLPRVNMQAQRRVIVIRPLIALLILYAVFGLTKKAHSAQVLGTVAVRIRHPRTPPAGLFPDVADLGRLCSHIFVQRRSVAASVSSSQEEPS